MNKYQQKHIVKLSNKERKQLKAIISRGSQNARVIKRAQVLLASDAGQIDKDISEAIGVTTRTVERIRIKYVDNGHSLDPALYDAPRPGQKPALDDKGEAYLVATACSSPPEGFDHWTLELLQEKLLKDKKTEHISTVAIWHRLKDRGIKPWREKNVVRTQAQSGIH